MGRGHRRDLTLDHLEPYSVGLDRIESYAFISDTHSAALVSQNGSIDWLCLPRFDSPSCFGAILDAAGGHWRIAPTSSDGAVERRYRDESLVLETTFSTSAGSVTIEDCLPLEEGVDPGDPRSLASEDVIVRSVRGRSGSVEMAMEFAPRFDYGEIVPWFRRCDFGVEALGGPWGLTLQATVPLDLDAPFVRASFVVSEGDCVHFAARYHESHLDPDPLDMTRDCELLVEHTDEFWRAWAARCTYHGRWRDEVVRSLLVLKGLTYSPTGGIVAAATTSLPEDVGGERNWDYRFCWLRDATFTIEVLLDHGYTEEAAEWRDWLLRAVAGDPQDLQIMYGVRSERRLTELELPWLNGYEGSRPVRIGNGAVEQFQLDVPGEIMDALYSARRAGLEENQQAWDLQREIVEFACSRWREPEEGIWEVRSGVQHFVHSKVMAWVAVDRGIKMIEDFGRTGPLDHWRRVRSEIKADVLDRGFDRRLGRFKRAYDDSELDAALLTLPLVGFIEVTDDRMRATVEAIENELLVEGFVYRYATERTEDGLSGGEGAFLMCSFWLVDCFMLLDRYDHALDLFERLLSVRNDLGLLAEQYAPDLQRQVGNFPQAFSHVALATSAMALERRGASPGLLRGQTSGR